MPFRPKVNNCIEINHNKLIFTEHPSAKGMPYGQTGRRATVYQLLDENQTLHALKVFTLAFRSPHTYSQSKMINKYSNLPGLFACKRIVLTPINHYDLLYKYPDLKYSVLMPWIKGSTWQEILLSKVPIKKYQSKSIASSLIKILYSMEKKEIAHCDLSGPNVIIDTSLINNDKTTGDDVNLIDLEDLYSRELPAPEKKPGGSAGYSHKTSKNGIWSMDADRFPGTILLSEILGWSDPRVRENAYGEQYFDISELQKPCWRYDLLISSLTRNWGKSIGDFLEKAWLSSTNNECPSFFDWGSVLVEDFCDHFENANITRNVEGPVRGWRSLSEDPDLLPASHETIKINPQICIQNNNIKETISNRADELTNKVEVNSIFIENPKTIHSPTIEPTDMSFSTPQKKRKSVSPNFVFFLLIIGLFLFIFLSQGIMSVIEEGRINQIGQQNTPIAKNEQNLRLTDQANSTAEAYFRATETIAARNSHSTQTAQISSTKTMQAITSLVSQFDLGKIKIFGTEKGSFDHLDDDYVETYFVGDDLKNFILEVNFISPYNVSINSWDFGVMFRHHGNNNQYRLIVSSEKKWQLRNNIDSSNGEIIQDGKIANLQLSEGSSNNLKLYVIDDLGILFLNDHFISELDLSARRISGAVAIGTGFFNGNEVEGEKTQYTNFSIWKFAENISPTSVTNENCKLNKKNIVKKDHYMAKLYTSYYEYEVFFFNENGWGDDEYNLKMELAPSSPTSRCSIRSTQEDNCVIRNNDTHYLSCKNKVDLNYSEYSAMEVSQIYCKFVIELESESCGSLYEYAYSASFQK